MRTRLKLLLTSPEFRKIWFDGLKTGFFCIIRRPFDPIFSMYRIYKFKKQYPDKWERYIAVKNLESENAKYERIREIVQQRMNLTHSTTGMIIIMLKYVESISVKPTITSLADFDYLELDNEFSKNQTEALDAIKLMRSLGATVPTEFDTAINLMHYNAFDSFRDVEDVARSFKDFDKRIEYGEE